jgi:6-phosphogluconolactonase (cycloisomerase 2 family)
MSAVRRSVRAMLVPLVLSACGGGGGGGAPTPQSPPPTSPTYMVGGAVTGLAGAGLVLQINGGSDLAVAASGTFSFPASLATGATYSVSVLIQPATPWQTCTVTSGGSGIVAAADVTSVVVGCVTNTYAIAGVVAGLDSAGLVLQLNGNNDLAVAGNGAFSFPANVASGTPYEVTVKTQPSGGPAQRCVVTNGAGTVTNAPPGGLTVTCAIATGKFIYVANQASNDVSAFTIDFASGALAPVAGAPFAAGDAPATLSADPSARFLYVANRGSATSPPTLSGYAVDSASGALAAIAGSPFPLSSAQPPPNGQATAIGKPLVHPSGLFAYLTIPVPTGRLFGASLDPTTGKLLEIPGMPITLGWELNGGSFDSAGGIVYFPHINGGLPVGYVTSYSISQPSGDLTPIGSFDTQGRGGVAVVVAPNDSHALVPNIHTMNVSVMSLNSGVATPVAGSPVSTPAGAPNAMAYHRTKSFVYVTENTGNRVFAYQFAAVSGALTPIPGSPYSLGGTQPGTPVIERSGKFLYVALRGANAIQAYSVDQTSGALTPVAGAPFSTGASPSSATADPSGRFLYVANSGANTVTSYRIGATTGALTAASTVPTGTDPRLVEVVGLQ